MRGSHTIIFDYLRITLGGPEGDDDRSSDIICYNLSYKKEGLNGLPTYNRPGCYRSLYDGYGLVVEV